MNSLTLTRVALRSLQYFFKSQAAVGLGIAAATAVIVGALVVGDSVRGSLRGLVLDRLANVQGLLHARTFFDPQLVSSLALPPALSSARDLGGENATQSIVPFIYLASASVEHRGESQVRRSAKVQIFGVGDAFWKSAPAKGTTFPAALNEDEIALSTALATELEAQVGDELTLRFHSASGVPADSPLGKRDDTIINLPRQKVAAILPDRGIGGLSFQSTQDVPRNIFCSLASLQDSLACEQRVNAALVLDSRDSTMLPLFDQSMCDRLDNLLKPKIEDYGLKLERITRVYPDSKRNPANSQNEATSATGSTEQIVYDYFQLTSNSLILESDVSSIVKNTLEGRSQRVLTYLANTITKVEPLQADLMRRDRYGSDFIFDSPPIDYTAKDLKYLSRPVPYSTVVGLEETDEAALQEFNSLSRENRRTPYCWINSWLATEIAAVVGDWIEIKFYEPETIDGAERERSVRCMIVGIAPLTEPTSGFGPRNRAPRFDSPPTIYNDPDLTPTVPGLTDKESISNWDAPFELNLDLLQQADDDYYDNHRLTPKVFLPLRLAASSEMFGSRFGHTTAIRFPAKLNADETKLRGEIENALWSIRGEHGFRFQPVRQQLLHSASGTTPFDMLFLSLSFFVIVSALMLVGLLFKLGITQRATQLGLLAAQGFTPSRVRGLMLREMAGVALLGAGLGLCWGWHTLEPLLLHWSRGGWEPSPVPF
jgi:putative ABC transport system permease protein